MGFSHGSEDPPDFGGVSSDDDHHRTPLRHSLDAATLDLDAHNPFRNSASLSSSDEASGTMAVRAADSFGSVTEMAPLSEEAEAETGVAGEGQAGAETEAENPREVASPEEVTSRVPFAISLFMTFSLFSSTQSCALFLLFFYRRISLEGSFASCERSTASDCEWWSQRSQLTPIGTACRR